ncbi:MAG: hypothetical protein ACK5HU_05785 [Flavobacteriales bacterium]
MKKIILNILLCFFISCNSENTFTDVTTMGKKRIERLMEKSQDFEINLLEGYFLKNDINLQEDINIMVFNTRKEFDFYFDVAQTMDTIMPSIDFNTERIAGILMDSSDVKMDFNVLSSKQIKTKIQIVYDIKKGAIQPFITSPIYLFKIPKNDFLQSIEFIHNNYHKTIILP